MSVNCRHRTHGALRLALSVSVPVAVAAWVVGCGEPQPPVAIGSMPELTVEVDSTESVDLAGYFSDPDGDGLSYSASSSDEGVATASASGASLTVAAVGKGTATVTVTATDPGGLPAEQSFTVTVPNRAPEVSDPIPDADVHVGETVGVDLAGNFSDPDGDGLSYAASSSNAEVATVAISGNAVTITGVAIGSAEIIVTGTDDGGFSAAQDFTASVRLTARQVLEILYDELGGDGWTDNTNWKTDKPLAEWYGVRINADGRVAALDLPANSLTGEIPPELGDLSNLRRLHLGSNSLAGEIPPELGNLSDLVWLDLATNRLTGEIPSELGSLSKLETLSLYGNWLTGEIPSELGDLSNLRRLHLDYNWLTGEIPPDFLDLSLLELFYWDGNEGLCAPDTTEFDNWLDGLRAWRGPRCD